MIALNEIIYNTARFQRLHAAGEWLTREYYVFNRWAVPYVLIRHDDLTFSPVTPVTK